MLSNIRAKLIVAFLLLIVVPISVLSLLSYQKTEQIMLDNAREHSLRTMQNARTFFIEDYITKTEGAVIRMSQRLEERLPAGGSPAASSAQADWDRYRMFNPGVAAVYFADSEGRFYLSSRNQAALAIDARRRPWYIKAAGNPDKVVWTDVYLDALNNRPIITAAQAVVTNQQFLGVLGMDTSLPVLADIVKKISFEQGGYAILIDAKGQIIGHPDYDKLGGHVADESWYWDIRNSYEGSMLVSLDGKRTMLGYITIPQTGWKLVGFIPEENIDRELAPIRARTLGLGLVAAILAVAIGVLFAHDIARRLQSLVAAMTAVEQGDFTARWQDHSSAEFSNLSGKFNAMVTTLENLIYQQQASQHQIALQKVYFEQLFESSPESIAIIDQHDIVIRVNSKFCAMFGYTADEVEGRTLNELIVPPSLIDEGFKTSGEIISANQVVEMETMRQRKDGRLIEVFVLGYPIFVMGKPAGGYVIYRDISERKETERQLTFASTHDLLTGVYNRRYFEQQMAMLDKAGGAPGIIIADIDGLKLVNDTLGHAVGDSMIFMAAVILRENLPEDADLCRIGGDEFAALLPDTDEATLAAVCSQIKEAVTAANGAKRDFAVSMSLGYGLKGAELASMKEVYREADSGMYREKLQRSSATRSALINTLTEALHDREYITEGKDERFQELMEKLARAAGLPEKAMDDLKLLAQFHDVGKVGVPEELLFKTEKLTATEMRAIRRHSEVGYRIAVSSPDFHHIADWILKHHEWWNGGGYPLGLKGEEIPLECRILLIVDAYEAMTHDRPYRKAMAAEAALAEIKASRGVMFDPVLVDKFVALMNAELR